MRTAKCGWEFPNENERSWFAKFVSMMAGVDEAVFVGREQRNVFAMTSAVFTYAAGALSWDRDILFLCPTTGYFWTVPVGSKAVANGEALYLTLPASIQGGTSLTFEAGPPAFNDDVVYLFAYRYDSVTSRLYFKSGSSLGSGESSAIFASTGDMMKSVYDTDNDGTVDSADYATDAGDSDTLDGSHATDFASASFQSDVEASGIVSRGSDRACLALASDREVTQAVGTLACCQFEWDANYWDFSENYKYTFAAVLWATGPTPGIGCTVELYNVTDGEVLGTTVLSSTSGTPEAKESGEITCGVAVGDLKTSKKLYEVRVILTGGADPADTAYLGSCRLQQVKA